MSMRLGKVQEGEAELGRPKEHVRMNSELVGMEADAKQTFPQFTSGQSKVGKCWSTLECTEVCQSVLEVFGMTVTNH